MGSAAGRPVSQEPLKNPVNSSGVLQTGGEPDPHCNCREQHCKKRAIVLGVAFTVVFSALLIAVIVLSMRCSECQRDLCPLAGLVCPDSWVGYRGKCYYFSEDQGDWASSQTNCSALSASLAGIDTWQDRDFMVRYKGRSDHWIGLRREPGQPWKWVNGTEFNNWFRIGGGEGGDCAYLSDQDLVSSLRCTSKRYWVCAKPDMFAEAKKAARERGS